MNNMYSGKIETYRGKLQIAYKNENGNNSYINVDNKCEIVIKEDDVVEFDIKEITPKNGNKPFSIAIIKKIAIAITSVDKEFMGYHYFRVSSLEEQAPQKGEKYIYNIPITKENLEWASKTFSNYKEFKEKLENLCDLDNQSKKDEQAYKEATEIKGKVITEANKFFKTASKEEIYKKINLFGLSIWEFKTQINKAQLNKNWNIGIPYVSKTCDYNYYKDLMQVEDDVLFSVVITYKFIDKLDISYTDKAYNTTSKFSEDTIEKYKKLGFYLTREVIAKEEYLIADSAYLYNFVEGSEVWYYKFENNFPFELFGFPKQEGIYRSTNELVNISNNLITRNMWELKIKDYTFIPAVEFPFTKDCDTKEINNEYIQFANIKTICIDKKEQPVVLHKEICEEFGFKDFFEFKNFISKYFQDLSDLYINSYNNKQYYDERYSKREIENVFLVSSNSSFILSKNQEFINTYGFLINTQKEN